MRIPDSNGNPINFTCRNKGFKTNIEKENSYYHGKAQVKGSVIHEPLVTNNNGDTLWIEHVISNDTNDRQEYFWLMWYDSTGKEILPMSAVFLKEQLITLINNIKVIDINF